MQPSDGPFFLAGERHADFDEPGAVAANGVIPAGSIVVNSRCVPQLPADPQAVARRVAPCTMWRCGNQMAALRLREPMDALEFADGSLSLDEIAAGTGAIAEVHGWWLDDVWDLIRLLQDAADSRHSDRHARNVGRRCPGTRRSSATSRSSSRTTPSSSRTSCSTRRRVRSWSARDRTSAPSPDLRPLLRRAARDGTRRRRHRHARSATGRRCAAS